MTAFAACCVTEHDHQLHSVLCLETGAEFIWSPAEAGTFQAAIDEHVQAHIKAEWRIRNAVSAMNYHFTWCRLVQCPQHEHLFAAVDEARAAYSGSMSF